MASRPASFPRAAAPALIAVLVLLAFALGTVALRTVMHTAADEVADRSVAPRARIGTDPGAIAPAFSAPAYRGATVSLDQFRGHPIVLNFWASWCPPCRAENPDIESVYNAHKGEGLVLLAAAIGEGQGAVAGYMQRADLHYPVGADSDTQIAADYRVLGIPTHVFVDKEGIVRDIRVGAMSQKTMEKKVSAIIAAQ